MFARIALALPLGTAVAATLLFMMHQLIANGEVPVTPTAYRIVEFTRVERTEAVRIEEKRPDPPSAPAAMPELTLLDSRQESGNTIEVAVTEPEVRFLAGIDGVHFESSDGEYLPMYKASPQYPVRALQRRLEGYVIVEFVVTAAGAVRDVIVVESSSPIFEQAAGEAALKFKYQPRVIDGQPIEGAGVQKRIALKLNA
jgi:protein TonB